MPDTPSRVGLDLGMIAPEFELQTLDGQKIVLSDLVMEKPVIIEYFTTWCRSCRQDIAIAKRLYPEFKENITFLLGEDKESDNPFYTEATNYYLFNEEGKTERVITNCRSLLEVQTYVLRSFKIQSQTTTR